MSNLRYFVAKEKGSVNTKISFTRFKGARIRSYLVRIFPGFSRIRTEYGEILRISSISLYSVRMRENSGKMRTRITPNTDSFYAVSF